jgi:hypothetical protein
VLHFFSIVKTLLVESAAQLSRESPESAVTLDHLAGICVSISAPIALTEIISSRRRTFLSRQIIGRRRLTYSCALALTAC